MQFRVYYLKIAGRSDIAGANRAAARHIETHLPRALRLRSNADALDVQQQLHDLFFDPGDRRVLVYNVVDLYPGYSAAIGGTEQNPAHRVAQSKGKTPLQGLNGYFAVHIVGLDHVDIGFDGFRYALGRSGRKDKRV